MNEKMKPRQHEILKFLATSSVPLDVAFFQNEFDKSERTIRYDINELKRICAEKEVEIRYRTRWGFYIPAEQKAKCPELLIAGRPGKAAGFLMNGSEKRIMELFFYFFVNKKDIPAEQIAGKFYISRSTFMRIIPGFNQYFGGRIRLLAHKTGGYELKGDELIIRHIVTEYLALLFKGSYTPEDWYLLMPDTLKKDMNLQRLVTISNEIKKVNAQYNVWISNSAFLNLLSYCIASDIRNYFYSPGDLADEAQGYAQTLLKRLNKKVNGTELNYLNAVLIENEIVVNIQETDERKVNSSLKKIMEYLKKEEKKLNYEFDMTGLFEDLYGHLKNLLFLYMVSKDKTEENYIVIQEVKENYYDFYRMAAECSKILEQDYEIEFTDTEICYIAVYLYKNCKEQVNKKKNVLLVCGTGKGLSHLLSIRLENVFPMLKIAGQVSPYQLSNMNFGKTVDFIISTIPLKVTGIPVLKISRILSMEDIKRIQEFLDYGKLVDEIPLQERDRASFNSKTDPFEIAKTMKQEAASNNLSYAAGVISKLILTLLEYTSKFPEEYRMSQDVLLGLIIHMSMAVPRWFQGTSQDTVEEMEEEYIKIEEDHRVIFEIMEKFFALVENSLQVSITIEERIAFFLYIVKEERDDECTDY